MMLKNAWNILIIKLFELDLLSAQLADDWS